VKKHIDRRLLGSWILGGAALLAPAAQAAEPVWTHVAGACVIDKNSVAHASVLESELRFDAGQVGEIVARCNVVNPKDDGSGPIWRALEVVYRDPDGNLLPNQVGVILKRVNNAGANFVVAAFDSNVFAGGAAPVMNSVLVAHVFNFSQNAYWVEIRIKRSALPTPNAANNPAVFLVRLRA
jgi:hypothetical protein